LPQDHGGTVGQSCVVRFCSIVDRTARSLSTSQEDLVWQLRQPNTQLIRSTPKPIRRETHLFTVHLSRSSNHMESLPAESSVAGHSSLQQVKSRSCSAAMRCPILQTT